MIFPLPGLSAGFVVHFHQCLDLLPGGLGLFSQFQVFSLEKRLFSAVESIIPRRKHFQVLK